MKSIYLTLIALCAVLLVSSCSKNEELVKPEVSISTISASEKESTGADTRTLLQGNRVTWVQTDRLGCMEVSLPQSNNQFDLTHGAGSDYGIFTAANPKNCLKAGTWVAYYPFSKERYSKDNKYEIIIQKQKHETVDHVAAYDWLISDPITIDSEIGSKIPPFKMRHVFALVEFRVRLKEDTKEKVELSQCVLETQDGDPCFAQRVYFDEKGGVVFDHISKNVSVSREPTAQLTTKFTPCWMLTHQKRKADLTAKLYFSYNKLLSSASVDFKPSRAMGSGHKYVLELEMELNHENPNSSVLTILK